MTRAGILVMCAACAFNSPKGASTEDASPVDGGGEPADDRDGDGIANGADLCPDDADPMQRDHDGDLHGDACDGCPFLASASDPDQDGDGVGDACDPSPAVAGDARVLWIGFYPEDAARIADPARWRQAGGTWSIADGWVRVTASGADILRSLATVQRAVATSRFRLDDVSSGSAAAAIVSGVVGPSGSVTQLYQCALFQSSTRIGARSVVAGNILADISTTWPGSVDEGVIVDVASRFGGMFECSFAAPSTTVRSTRGAIAGDVELVVQDATVSFDYLFVVEPGS